MGASDDGRADADSERSDTGDERPDTGDERSDADGERPDIGGGPELPPGDDGVDDAGPPGDDEESMPPFFRYGLFTVGVYAGAMAAVAQLTTVDVGGPTLVAFTVGFLLFMTSYFVAMWIGWLYLT